MFAANHLILALILLCGQTLLVFSQDPSTASISENLVDRNSNEPVEERKALPKPEIHTLHVYSDIKYRYATTVVTSRVANVADKAQEVGFTVVLPETAFISDFLMVIQNKVYKAHVKGKEEAKAEYNEAVSQGRSAAHVEVSARNSNKFTVSVNIEAHGKVDFNLTYEELLTRSLGMYSHVVNLNPGQVVKNMSVTVTINESVNITKLEVPDLKMSNEITQNENSQNELATIERPSGQSAVIRWAADPAQQRQIAQDGINGQLVVNYDVDRETNPQQVLVDEGYFVHFFAPDSLPPLRKHAIFVLDYSGSMGGRKLEQLRDTMKTILSDMDSNDYFSLVLFSYKSAAWSPNRTNFAIDDYGESKILPVSEENVIAVTPENINLAIDFLKSFNRLGLTNIISGLRNGLQLADIGRNILRNTSAQAPEPIIMFLTDGLPNVDLDKPHLIIREVKRINTKRTAIFSLAFGYGADIKFLKKLSLDNNGFAKTIYEAADASLQLKNFYRQIASPLLSNITFSYLPGQIDNETSSRTHFPLLFSGSELIVAGKVLRPDENKDLNETVHGGDLTGISFNGTRTFPIFFKPFLHPFPFRPQPTLSPPVVSPKDPLSLDESKPGHLEKVWAFLTIKQLLDNAAIEKGDRANATRQRALDLALKYSFVTPLTSLVVVKPNATSSSVNTETIKPGQNSERGGPIGVKTLGVVPRMNSFMSARAFMPRTNAYLLPQASLAGLRGPYAPRMEPVGLSREPQGARGEPGDPSREPQGARGEPGDPSREPQGARGEPGDLSRVLQGARGLPGSLEKLNLSEVRWLFNYTSADNTSVELHIPGTDGNTQFRLGLNETDTVFGHCTTPRSAPGECRHFHHCILRAFINRVEDFFPYRCNIASGFLGTCCTKL